MRWPSKINSVDHLNIWEKFFIKCTVEFNKTGATIYNNKIIILKCLKCKIFSGNKLVAAGYCVFGTACMMVLSTGNGVNGFTLDPSIGEFILTAGNMQIPKKV